MLETEIRKFLLEHKELTDLINTKIYPGWVPANVSYPALTYLNVSSLRHHDIDVAYPRIQFSVFSPRYLEAKEITEVLRKILQRHKGQVGNMNVMQIVYENSYEMYEEDKKVYHIATDYKFIYWEVS